MSGKPVPVEIKQSGVRELRIAWSDGQVNDFDVVELRRSCRCANCVDELTGAQILHPSQVGEDVRPQTIRQVGNYAFQVNWTDGHPSGPAVAEDGAGPRAGEEKGAGGGGCGSHGCGCSH